MARAKFGIQFKISGLVMPREARGIETGMPDLPEFLWEPDHPQYAWYKRGRDSAFATAEERVALILRDSLRRYHSSRISPYGRSLRAIRTKMMPATKSDNSPLGRRIWIGYQPNAGEDQDTPTDRGVTKFMLSTIYGVMPGRIHPPFKEDGSPMGPWAKEKSEVGAIYGSNEFAGFPGGRLGHWAVTKGILPNAQYITKPQQRPRGAKYYSRQKFGGKVYENEYAKGPKAGTRRKPGRVASNAMTTVQHYVPYDIDKPHTTGRFAKRTLHWKANMFTGGHSMYHGKVVSNKSIHVRWETRKTPSGTKKVRIIRKGAVPFPKYGGAAEQEKLKKMGTGAISDKTWENAAKFIALSLERKGMQPKPVLREWYDTFVNSGMLMEEIQTEYFDAISKWNDYAFDQWKKHLYNVTREQYVGLGHGILGKGILISKTGRAARSVEDMSKITAGILFTGKFSNKGIWGK